MAAVAAATRATSAPLAHLRVLDLSRVLAGPWATQLLADLGAEVIKVEHPAGGDDTRHWGPPYLKDAVTGEDVPGEAAYYHAANRNKKSITVDIASTAGQDLLHRIVKDADVVVENFQAGKLARYRLGYEDLSAIRPSLVYTSITGYGQTGPRKDEPGYDFVIQGMTGYMSVTGDPNGPPQKVGVAIADLMTGLYTSTAILAALQLAQQTGHGQHIDVALMDVLTACLANQGTNYLFSGVSPTRMGNTHPNVAPYDALPCSDGYLILAVGNDRQFARACAAMDLDELAIDRRYSTNAQRIANRGNLTEILAKVMRTKPKAAWLETFRQAGVPCSPINTIAELFADPQAIARQLEQTVRLARPNRQQRAGLKALITGKLSQLACSARMQLPHPLAGTIKTIANPLRLSHTPIFEYRHAPLLGQHNDEIIQRYGPGVTPPRPKNVN